MNAPIMVRLSGGVQEISRALSAEDRAATRLSLADFARSRQSGRGRRLIVAGSPPEDEIGYGFIPFLVARDRPHVVATLSLPEGRLLERGRHRFIIESLPMAVAQFLVSGLAICGQGLAVKIPVRPVSDQADGQLERMVYLRPHAGVPAGVGGSITHTLEVLRILREVGVEVSCYTTDPSVERATRESLDRVVVWSVARIPRVAKALPASAAFAADLAIIARARGVAAAASVIYQRHSRFSLAGALLSRWTGTPLFLEYNGSEGFFAEHWQPTPFARRLLACEDAILAAASRVFVVSEVERVRLLERGVAQQRIVVNPNGVDAARFGNGGGTSRRQELGVPPSGIVVGFVGSFGRWHGAPVLAAAFNRLVTRRSDIYLLLVGDGPDAEETLRVANQSGGGTRVRAIGKVHPDAIPTYLDACDILASPHVSLPDADFFGSPTKLFEYMAAGKAIVASAVGQIADVLEEGESALLIPPGDPAALADAIERLATDRALRERLGHTARRHARERHSWRANGDRITAAYEAFVKEGA